MSRWTRARSRPGVALLGVLAALAAGMGAATATAPAAGEPAAAGAGPAATRQVPVARATRACPDPVSDPDDATTTTVTVAAPGGTGGTGGTGSAATGPEEVTLGTLGGRALPDVRALVPGSAAVTAAAGQDPLVARAVDAAAPGFAAGQLTRSTTATMRGLAGLTCAAPGSDAWFVGSGAVVGQRGRVYLTNTEAAPAVVDVTLYGPDGPIDAPDARGVTIAAGAQQVRLLDALAPGVERFAIHVHARQGRVAAAVRDLQVDGLTPLGADWVPPASAPAREVVVAGVPAGAGERLLQVVTPGASDAIVRLRLIGPAGTFAPAGLDVLEVRAGTVAEVDLAPFTAGEPVSVELRADAPVTAGVLARVTGSEGQLGEIAWAAAAEPLTPRTPGVVPEVRQGEGVTSQLLLSAAAGDAVVDLAPLPPATGPGSTVTVLGGSLLVVDLVDVSTAGAFALTVVPRAGSGPVHAVRQVDEEEQRGPFVTSTPVEPGRFTVPVPRVVADLSAGLRAGR